MGQLPLSADYENMVFEGELSVRYSGLATENHTMDAALYAKSLLGFTTSFRKVNNELLGGDFVLEIVAEEEGSVKAVLAYAVGTATFYASLVTILAYHGIEERDLKNAPIKLYQYVVDNIKESKGNKEVLISKIQEMDIPKERRDKLIKVVVNNDLRLALDDMTLFLEKNGLEKIEVFQDEQVYVDIDESERDFFRAQPEDSVDIVTYRDYVSVVAIGAGNDWRFQGVQTKGQFSAKLQSEEFLKELRIRSANDIFKMVFVAEIIKTTVTKAGNKKPSQSTYEIVTLEHEPQPEELSLPIAYDRGGD